METLKIVGLGILVLIIIGAINYGIYWMFKTMSYSFFYESMVQDTIREMVKPEYLNSI